jgi:hypothetical protein
MKKALNILLYALLAIAVIPLFLWIFGVFGPFAHKATEFGGADVMLTLTAIYLAIAVVLMIVMTAMNIGKSKGGNGKLNLIVFGGLAVLAIVVWFGLASAAPVTGADGKVYDNATTLKLSDTGLWLAYATVAIAVLTMVWGTVRKALK